MRILAYMPVYNGADVLPFVLAHLRAQGIEVHALEGWSTDESYEILRTAGPGVWVERFPMAGPSPIQCCRAILHRIEELAPQSGADWCLLNDDDEWRRSPRAGETLAQGIERVDRAGYSVIDHRVFFFLPTDDGWTGDPQAYFRHYTEDPGEEMLCRIPQQKCWRNRGQAIKLDGGGHQVRFPGARIYPEKFVLKHYPYRSSAQAKAKLATRLARRDHEEHAMGWGVHYDLYGPDFTGLWDPGPLKYWRDTSTPLP